MAILFLLIVSATFYILTQTSPTNLLMGASNIGFGNRTNKIAYFYLTHSKKLQEYNSNKDNLPALQFILSGCTPADAPCLQTATWLMEVGDGNVNFLNPKTGMGLLHDSVMSCDPSLTRFALAYKADVHLRASSDTHPRIKNRTALELLDEVENCEEHQEIRQLLTSF